jgi:hypothetical protein
MTLRRAEWINILAFSCFVALAWTRRGLDRKRKTKISAIGATGAAITLFVTLLLPGLVSRSAVEVVRDWVPFLLLTMFYWQAGQFVTRTDTRLEERLQRLDRSIVAPLLEWCARSRLRGPIFTYLEIAYLSYYLSLPLSLAALYLTGRRSQSDLFWTVVLLASYGCCAALPFLPTRPPRALAEKWSEALPAGKVRAFNQWILRGGSIQTNTFPSVHVAAATACALVLLSGGPLWVGLVFLWIAFSIALGAVGGRYHYAADAVLGAAAAGAALLIGIAIVGPQ